MRFARIGLFCAATCLMANPVVAQVGTADQDGARREFEAALVEFGQNNFALALRAFQRSYEMLEGHPRRPLVLFNMGRCYEELGRYEEARDAYRRYLQGAGDGAASRGETEERLRELETRVALDREAAAPGTSPAQTGPTAQPGPAAQPGPVPASGGEVAAISPVGPVLLAVGGATILAGAILGGVTLASHGDVTAMCADMVCPEAARGDADQLAGLALATDILLVGGAAVAVTGLLLTLLLSEETSGDAVAGATCTGNGCAVFLSGRMN